MIAVGFEMHLTVTGQSDLDSQCDQLMDALLRLEETCNISDSAVSVDLGRRTVIIEVAATGENYDEAESTGLSCIRAAIHELGGHTPDWDEHSRRSEVVAA